jgi:hypothetical protein
MKVSHSLLAAAVSGIVLGATGCGGSQPEPATEATPAAEAPAAAAPAAEAAPAEGAPAGGEAAAPAAKHDCKGKNDCKGQGGCKS